MHQNGDQSGGEKPECPDIAIIPEKDCLFCLMVVVCVVIGLTMFAITVCSIQTEEKPSEPIEIETKSDVVLFSTDNKLVYHPEPEELPEPKGTQ